MRCFIIVGEMSGDVLGAAIIKNLTQKVQNLSIAGIFGPNLTRLSRQKLFDVKELEIFGLIEPLKHLARLNKIKNKIINYLENNHIDIFIGIDAPDFNFRIEKIIKNNPKLNHIKICHIVSPSVWAWRSSRINLIEKITDKLLILFPFEKKYYQHFDENRVVCIGHPLADKVDLNPDKNSARQELAIAPAKTIVALLPGSREKEIKRLAKLTIQTAKACWQRDKNLCFVLPVSSMAHKNTIEKIHKKFAFDIPLKIILNNTILALTAADIALVASGTATLEALLCKTPMVVIYKLNWLTYFFGRLLVKIPYISLPNILAEDKIVPEVIQNKLNPEYLADLLLTNLEPTKRQNLINKFAKIHQTLKLNAAATAAHEIQQLYAV